MLALLGASAITLATLQATISAPTDAFRSCLREASAKATGEKVAPDAIEQYLRSACTVQMGSLKSAVVAFRTKNGMARKAAVQDADMTVEDYIATPVDKYKFMAEQNAPASAKAAATQAAPVQAASTKPQNQ
jgi:hypothetical protein